MATLEAISGQAQSNSGKVEVSKTTQAAGEHHGLTTPEPSLGPDEAQNQVDEQRRQAASSKTTEKHEQINTPSTQSNHDGATKDPPSNKLKGTPTSQGMAASKMTQAKVGKKKVAPNDKQKGLAVTKVLRCESTAYSKILEVKPESSKEDMQKAYVRLCVLTNPKNNKFKGASNAYKSK